MARATFRYADELDQFLEDELGYGGSKSAVFREAVHEKIEREFGVMIDDPYADDPEPPEASADAD